MCVCESIRAAGKCLGELSTPVLCKWLESVPTHRPTRPCVNGGEEVTACVKRPELSAKVVALTLMLGDGVWGRGGQTCQSGDVLR